MSYGIGASRYRDCESRHFWLSTPTRATTHNGNSPIFRFGLLTFLFRYRIACSRFQLPKQSSARSGGLPCLRLSGGLSGGDDEQARNECGNMRPQSAQDRSSGRLNCTSQSCRSDLRLFTRSFATSHCAHDGHTSNKSGHRHADGSQHIESGKSGLTALI